MIGKAILVLGCSTPAVVSYLQPAQTAIFIGTPNPETSEIKQTKAKWLWLSFRPSCKSNSQQLIK
jgi:hypothetical protein